MLTWRGQDSTEVGRGRGKDATHIDTGQSLYVAGGIAKSIAITGNGEQHLSGVAPATAGRAWVQFSSFDGEDETPAHAKVGSHDFADTGYYLLQLQL